jgi:hypothetical protein
VSCAPARKHGRMGTADQHECLVCMQSVKYAFQDQRSYYEHEEQLRLAQLALEEQQEQQAEGDGEAKHGMGPDQELGQEQWQRKTSGTKNPPLVVQQQPQQHTMPQGGRRLRHTASLQQEQEHQQREPQQAAGTQHSLSQQRSGSIKANSQQQDARPRRRQHVHGDELMAGAARGGIVAAGGRLQCNNAAACLGPAARSVAPYIVPALDTCSSPGSNQMCWH